MFGCDVLGKRLDGTLVALQVTAGVSQAVTARKRKLEQELWQESDMVQLLQLVSTENPGKGARKLWFFRVYEYEHYNDPPGWVFKEEVVSVPRLWFKKWKAE